MLSLSHTQRGLWFLHRLHPGSTAYHMATLTRVVGDVPVEAIRASFQRMLDRHPALRTTFPLVGDEPAQVIPEAGEVAFEVVEATGWSAGALRAAMEAAAYRPFDLQRGPIFRATVFVHGAERYLVAAMHHIVSDFAALANLLREAPPEGKSFAQFVAWQAEMLAGPEGERLEAFWRERLDGLPELNLPADRVKPAHAPEQAGAVWRTIAPATLGPLKALARAEGATLYVVLLAAWQTLLSRYTGQEDFAVGSPVAGRPAGYGRVFGYFTNPLVLRADLAGDPPFRTLVERTRRRVVEALDHQHFPLPLLVERLRARSELFRTLFVFHRAPAGAEGLVGFSLGRGGARLPIDGFALESLPNAPRGSQFDLTLAAGEMAGALELQIVYDAARFDAPTPARWLQHFDRLLAGVAENPECPLSALPLLTPWERHHLLAEVNDGADAGLPWPTLHEGFERQARQTPQATALIDGLRRLTYQELDERATALAEDLRRRGAGPETVVAVKLPRTAELIVALLGVLKSGAAYLPLDPTYPEERIAFMLADAGAEWLLGPGGIGRMGPIRPIRPIEGDAGSRRLAYLIYTSGSTGRPKGVAIEHAAAVRLVAWARAAFSPAERAGVLAATSVNFDLSIFEIFVPLSTGGAVILAENALALPELPARGEVTLVNTVPSALAGLLEMGPLPPSVRTVNLAGEPLRRALADQILATGVKLWDLYGPSEDTTYSTGAVVAGEPGEPLIGWPLAGSRAFVLDRRGDPAPLGVPGELCLGGGGLARGYLGRPELTAEKFIPAPFDLADPRGARLYRTGDLVRRRPDGALEYLGRLDHQVKIRGFRIELGEVEAALLALPGVRETVVVAQGGALVAYVVGEAGALEEALRQRLPAPFVPSFFVALDALPRTPNGKVDRKALPAPVVAEEHATEAPVGPVEEAVAAVWAAVLGRERIGRFERFFELGGHSLLAARVVARLREALGLDLPLTALFDAPTVAGLALRIAAARAAAEAPLVPVPRDRPLPLSFAQHRLWFLDRLEPGSPLYNVPIAFALHGPFAPARLEGVLSAIERRHEALRTVYPAAAGVPRQEILPAQPFSLPAVDLSGLPEAVRETVARGLRAAEARRPFDLERGPVWRALCVRHGETRHEVLLTLHHIAGDGWSLDVLERDVAALFTGDTLPPLPVQPADAAVWQRERLTGARLAADLAWWRTRLAGAPPLDVPGDRPRPAAPTVRGFHIVAPFPADLATDLRALRRHAAGDLTLYQVLLAGFVALLGRWSDQRDVVLGAPVAGRGRTELDGVIGLFVNTLVLRFDLTAEPGFAALAGQARSVVVEAQAQGEMPFERLVEELAPDRAAGRAPLAPVLFDLAHAAPPRELPGGLRLRRLPVASGTAKLDLILHVQEEGDTLTADLEASADLFDRTTGRRLVEAWLRLLAAAVRAPEVRFTDLPLLSAVEQAEIVCEWNDTAGEAPRAAHLYDLFDRHVRERPDSLAVVWNETRLTWEELAARVSALAQPLRALGVGPEVPVAFCRERGPGRLVALLAILQADGLYVPLDPAWPDERLAWILDDCAAPVLLTESSLQDRFRGFRGTLLREGDEVGAPASTPLRPRGTGAAYLIYTSGSTGRPKGVLIEHRAAASHASSFAASFGLGPDDRMLQVASIGFDLSVEEIFVAFAAGAVLHIGPAEMALSATVFLDLCRRWGLTMVTLTTAFWHEIVREIEARPEALPPTLRLVTIGGETVLPERVAAWWRHAGPDVRLFNTYGPTEATVIATGLVVGEDTLGGPFGVPLGPPLPHIRAYVLDRALRPVPPGVPGELCIGGAGVGRGYLGRPDLTAERFVPDPFGLGGDRLYRTGDRARHRPDGRLEFLGRVDHQVKIRGFRIEPGETEAVLATCPLVAGVAVLALPDDRGELRLAAFVVPAPGAAPTPSALRAFLLARLPEHQVPSAFTIVPALPLTPNGKLDRRALARLRPTEDAAAPPARWLPRDPVEEQVAAVWAEVLEVPVEQIGPRADFFALGGHSLLATRIGARLHQAFGVDVPLRDVLEVPVIEELAARVRGLLAGTSAEAPVPPLLPVPRTSPPPLSFAQLRLWIIDRIEPGSAAYNVALAVRLEGALEPALLAAALGEVARRQEAVRTTFRVEGGDPVQIVHPPAPVPLPLLDLGALPDAARAAEALAWARAEESRPFDLENGPLLRAAVLRLAREEHLLLLNLHHAICDEWSLRLLFGEVVTLYAAGRSGTAATLPVLPVQYADFAVWQRGWLTGPVLAAQLAFWRERLADPPVLELPTDRPRPPVQTNRGARLPFVVPPATGAALRALGRSRGATAFMTCLAVWQALLARTAGQTDLTVGTPITGRSRAEVESLIGFFLNTLVLRADLSGDPGFAEMVDRARVRALEAFAHQDLPFEKLVDELGVRRSLGHAPLFQALFVLLHATPLPAAATGLRATPFATGGATAKFDLTLDLEADGDALTGVIEYNTDLFDATTARRLAARFCALAAGAAADPECPLSALPVLPEGEAHQILHEWNDRPPRHDVEVPLHGLVEAWADTDPERPAVEWEGGSFTYAELVGRARALAVRLRSLGVGPDVPVAVYAERGPELAVAFLAILEAGGAYLPIDPSYPQERQLFMLQDSGAPVLLVPESLLEAAPPTSARVVALTSASDGSVGSVGSIRSGPGSEATAYLIYTSGSTGRPKGVAVPHRVLANLILWQLDPARPGSLPGAWRTLQFASPSFDVSLHEMLATWCAGGTLVLASEEDRRDPERLVRHLAEAGVERLFLPFVALQQLADRLARPETPVPARLRRVITAGEQLQVTPQVVEAFRRLSAATGGTALHNHYGPSETHVVTELILDGDPALWPALPAIGRPLSGVTTHLLDRAFQPVPVGVVGELFLGGLSPARGYLGRPDQTAERFLPDPFSDASHPGGRLYRTGDRARLLPDGTVEFLGRIDHQVKIRGYRIEPGEIEAVLAAHPKVRECAVGVREGHREKGPGDRRLIAWVVTTGELGPTELRDHLRERLPEPMVPSAFVQLDALPLTGSGKVQRSALPAPEGERHAASPYVEPQSVLEKEIADVFRAELELDRVGRDDNFFDLGGHSLTMVRAAGRLSERLGRPVAVLDLFRTPTVASLARQLGGGEETLPARETLEERAATRRQSLGRRRELREKGRG